MIIGVLSEIPFGESRAALTPESVKKLINENDIKVHVESGLGEKIHLTDINYKEAGAKIETRKKILSNSDLILRINKPSIEEISQLKENSIHISFLDPFNEKELIEAFKKQKVSAISMEMIPRTSKAQKMDALSSQASLAGYSAVIIASERLNKILPMMMTPSGTISPSRVFIIGAGVAGLQAIATAKRLGARVEAFDTRAVVEEQVQSLGAKFIKIDLGETGQTNNGYAKALTEEQLNKQRKLMEKHCIEADIVITTAKLFGRKSPILISNDVIKKMKPGSVIVDLAVSTGGNVEASEKDKEIEFNGIKIIGIDNFPGEVAINASQMYSNNLSNLIFEFLEKEKQELILNTKNEIIKGCLICHKGEIINKQIKDFYEGEK